VSVSPAEPVSSIEGIGPAAVTALASVKVYSVFDLLRGSIQAIHHAVHSLASENEVRSWRAMASLLEVADVTPQWAEALVRAGVTSVEILFSKSLEEIDTLMAAAMTQRIIQQVPTAAQISNMLQDAAVLQHSGSVTGTLHNTEGEPVANATVRIGSLEQQSDPRGRFRIVRIPLGTGLPLFIEHDNYIPRTIAAPPVSRDLAVIDGRVFVMTARPEAAAGSSEEPQTALSELDGDLLPVPKGQPLKSVELDAPGLRPLDVLKVYKLYERTPDAGLVSYFKSYEAGRFIVHTLKVPRSQLADVQLGDQFRVTDGALAKVELGPNELRRYKLRLRLRKKMAGRTVPTADSEGLGVFLQECYAFLEEIGYFDER